MDAVLFAAAHYLALGVGAAGLTLRIAGLTDTLRGAPLKRVFLGDTIWGIAALLWLGTGLMRAFGGLEKGTEYYLASPWFHAKMGLFILICVMEIYPMQTLLRWRFGRRSTITVADHPTLRRMTMVSYVELALLPLLLLAASLMARS